MQEKHDRNKLSPIRTFGKHIDEPTSEFKPEIFQVTTDDETGLRSVVELLASEQTDQSRNSSVRVSTSVKDRLGKKIIKMKSRSRSPKAVKLNVKTEIKGFQSRSRDKSARSSKDDRSYGTGGGSSSRNNESNRQHVFVSSVSSKSTIDRRGGGGGDERRDNHMIDRSRINRSDSDFSRNVRNQSNSSSKRTSKVDKLGHSPNARETRDHNIRGTSKHKGDKNQTESSKNEKEKYQQKKDIESARKPELQSNKIDTKDVRHSSSSHVNKSSSSTASATVTTAPTKETKTPKKRNRSSSTSSCSSTQSSKSNASSTKQTKKHSSYKSKSKKKYRSSSTESILKRKKVKKIKKSKKKKTRK